MFIDENNSIWIYTIWLCWTPSAWKWKTRVYPHRTSRHLSDIFLSIPIAIPVPLPFLNPNWYFPMYYLLLYLIFESPGIRFWFFRYTIRGWWSSDRCTFSSADSSGERSLSRKESLWASQVNFDQKFSKLCQTMVSNVLSAASLACYRFL